MFLWMVCTIKVSVTASYVMGTCRNDIIVSVFCDVEESMDLLNNKEWRSDSAVYLVAPKNTSI